MSPTSPMSSTSPRQYRLIRSGLASLAAVALTAAGAEWYRMRPAEDEPRVVKRGYSGFLGTDLDTRLHAAGCDWLTVVGLTSERCVDATAQDAVQLDWPVVVPRDATAAYDLDVNAAALVQLGLNVAVLSDTDEVVELWKKGVR